MPPDSLRGMPRWVDFLRRTPCLVLLVVQLSGVVLYPFMEETYAGRAAFALFGLLVLALVVLTLRVTPFLTWVALLVAAPSAVLLVVSAVTDDPTLFVWSAVFTLLAWAFAYLFVVVQGLDPGGFNPDGQGTRTWMELLFLSFTTLSSTGLSDITPISGHARSVVMIEQVAGVFYIAMVVTRLVALRGQRAAGRPS